MDQNSDKTYFDLDSSLTAVKLEENVQEFTSSQIPLNQEFYEHLDQILLNQPKEIYLEKLIEETRDNEGHLEWYRRMLYDRASTIEGFPHGKLIARRDTPKSKSTQKLASDCFIIQMFISGDDTEIETVFSKSKVIPEPEQLDRLHNEQNFNLNYEIATMKAAIHSANSKIETLEKKTSALELDVQEKNKIIKQLNENLNAAKLTLSRLDDEQKTKFTIVDTFRKSTNSTLRNVGDFDNYLNDVRLKQIESNVKSVTNQVANCVKQIQGLKPYSSCITNDKNQSIYTSETDFINHASPSGACGTSKDLKSSETVRVKLNEYTENRMTNTEALPKSNVLKQFSSDSVKEGHAAIATELKSQKDQSIPQKSLFQHTTQSKEQQQNVTEAKSVKPMNSNVNERPKSQDYDKYPTNLGPKPNECQSQVNKNDNDKPVNINTHQHKENPNTTFRGYSKRKSSQQTNDNVFIAASRKHTTQFFIGNIHETSTYNGIATFLSEYEFHPTQIRLFRTRSGNLAARINIPDSEADYIDDVYWPDGIIVKKWLSKRELQERYENRLRYTYNEKPRRYNDYNNNGDYDDYQNDPENDTYDRYGWGYSNYNDWNDTADGCSSKLD